MCVCLPPFMSAQHMNEVPTEAGKGIRYRETVVRGDCEPSCGVWEKNPGPS